MDKLADFYLNFCEVGFDQNGVLDSFIPRVSPDFNFAYDCVDEIARRQPERRALVWCNDAGEHREFTYGEISRLSNRAANLFEKHGVEKGDRVMLVLKRHYQFWIAILALHKLGAVAIPATNLLTAGDFRYRFGAAGVAHVVCTAEGAVCENVERANETYGRLKTRFSARGKRAGWLDFDALLEAEPSSFSRRQTSADSPMLLYFTSGTTGHPKMVCHDYSYPVAHIVTAKFWHNVRPNGLHLSVSETGWAKSVWGKLYGQWLCAAAVFVYDMERFDAKSLLEKMTRFGVTSFCAPPTIYRFLIKENDICGFETVEYATVAGEALNPEVYRRFYELTGLKLMEAFGQTETTTMTLNPVGTTPKPGSMGKPNPLYNIDLVDENGHSVLPGEVGEIVLRAKRGEKTIGLFKGYYKDEALTAAVWRGGLYHTGDTAWRDEDGFFWYVGRTDDIIKSSGYRIGPFEIESVLMEHAAVLECAVTAAPDPDRGNVIKATVVLAKGYQPSGALKAELQAHVKSQTAPYKYPRIVEFVGELPKTISGKIRRAEIREKSA